MPQVISCDLNHTFTLIKMWCIFDVTGGSELHGPVALPRGGRAGRGPDHQVPPPHEGARVVTTTRSGRHPSPDQTNSSLISSSSPAGLFSSPHRCHHHHLPAKFLAVSTGCGHVSHLSWHFEHGQ